MNIVVSGEHSFCELLQAIHNGSMFRLKLSWLFKVRFWQKSSLATTLSRSIQDYLLCWLESGTTVTTYSVFVRFIQNDKAGNNGATIQPWNRLYELVLVLVCQTHLRASAPVAPAFWNCANPFGKAACVLGAVCVSWIYIYSLTIGLYRKRPLIHCRCTACQYVCPLWESHVCPWRCWQINVLPVCWIADA